VQRANLIAPRHHQVVPDEGASNERVHSHDVERRARRRVLRHHREAGRRLRQDTALLASVLAGNDLTEQIQKVLDDVLVAESWESMALRPIARSAPHDGDLVAVPVTAPRRTA
jgi:hypothetical protein